LQQRPRSPANCPKRSGSRPRTADAGRRCTIRRGAPLLPCAAMAAPASLPVLPRFRGLLSRPIGRRPDLRLPDFGWSSSGRCVTPRRASATGHQGSIRCLSYLPRRFPNLPPRVLGHSLGGQWSLSMTMSPHRSAVAVASGPGYWLDHPAHAAALLHSGGCWVRSPRGPRATCRACNRAWRGPSGRRLLEWRKLCLKRDLHRANGAARTPASIEDARFKLTLVPIADDIPYRATCAQAAAFIRMRK